MQKQRLGRGLGALIGAAGAERSAGNGKTLIEIAVGEIRPNPFQPRIDFDPARIEELAASISQKGILQPLIVSRKEDGGYELVVGERRLRAATRAGLSVVPCIVMEVPDEELLEVALIENLQREDLDPIEEARAYELMMEKFDLSHEEVARRVGRNRSTVSNSLRLLKLPDEIRAMVRGGELTAGHARTLVGLADRQEQVRLANDMVQKGLSVRDAEASRRERSPVGGGRRRAAHETDPAIRRVEEALQRYFGTLVTLKGVEKGSIVVKYYSMDDLNRILDLLGVEV